MAVNLETVQNLTRMVDGLIEMRKLDRQLTEEKVGVLIHEVINFCGALVNEAEIEAAKRDIYSKYQVYNRNPGASVLADYEQENWYSNIKDEIVPKFWSRYKNYLIDQQHFSPNIVSTLGEDTLDQKLMNYILNPNADYGQPVLRKGLIIGDVQSGKTSTYIGFICKAADAGYKVFILLTGTIETLRKQTQERVEEGFVGINMSADNTGGKRVGVGEDNKPIMAMALTSRKGDFTGDSNKIAVALSDKNAVVFVIKKQKNVLEKLIDWLVELNADPATGKIDIPMLMIDDEADNASINTSKDKEDPTTINKLIRKLANVFSKSNYVAFTATPFANVFIDPETTEKMETHDLFPEDFIMSLPTPSNYIGPTRIFMKNGEFHSQVKYINDAGREEKDGYPFYFKHKKNWEGELPVSLTDAIYAFYLVNAIRDLRGDIKTHRSMLINISRFIKVQRYSKGVIESIHKSAYRSIKFNLSLDFEDSMKDSIIKRIYKIWDSEYSQLEFKWEEIAETLYKSIENIQIKVVNSSKTSEKLEYPKDSSVRVIAIGGLALSRGLTLEGLVISYFYRNTCTFDVLMQMGRWFGYRKNYEDLFRIWTHKASADWYTEITEATEKLKEDMILMHELGQKPREFGIRVRNNSDELNITAKNKMRNSIDEVEILSYFGSFLETPYLYLNPNYQIANYNAVNELVYRLVNDGYKFERQKIRKGKGRYILQNVPKSVIIPFLRKLKISKFSSSFDINQISSFIESSSESCLEKFDIAFMEGNFTEDNNLVVNIIGRKIPKVIRRTCIIDSENDRLDIGRKGKFSGTSDGKAGIIDYGGMEADQIIEDAMKKYREWYKENKKIDFTHDKSYPSDTWFKFIEKRKPLLLVYFIDVGISENEENQKKQIVEFKDAMNGIPAVGFALGFPSNGKAKDVIKFKANKVYNWFEQEEILAEGSEE